MAIFEAILEMLSQCSQLKKKIIANLQTYVVRPT